MRKMTLREIQSVGLDIMKEIHSFCMENGIDVDTYSFDSDW